MSEEPKKRTKSKSALQRTMDALRKQGATVGKVEMPFNSFSKVRQDFLGCIDAIALLDGKTIGVQAAMGSGDHAKHIDKCMGEPRLLKWLQCGNLFRIYTWSKRKERGSGKISWICRVAAIHGLPDKAGEVRGMVAEEPKVISGYCDQPKPETSLFDND